jgi:hypothetical protein
MVGAASPIQPGSTPEVAKFTDVTSALGLSFEYVASHTAKKYLIETMGKDGAPDGNAVIYLADRDAAAAPTRISAVSGSLPSTEGSVAWSSDSESHRSFKSRVLYAVLPLLAVPASRWFNSARTLRANSIGRNGFSR